MTTGRADTHWVESYGHLSDWRPCPLVDWSRLAESVAPGKTPSRSRLRTLRKARHISDGVKVPQRDAKGLSGASSYYSVLSLWAERARSQGLEEDAITLSSAASALEDEFASRLSEFLGHHPFDRLPDVEFFWEFADRTWNVLVETKTWQDGIVAVASVVNIDEHFAHLEGHSREGTPRSVDLPTYLLKRHGLTPGSHVFVLSRTLGLGAYVELDEAVPSRENWLVGSRLKCFGASDPTRDSAGLRDYDAGPGAPLTREQAARAWDSARAAGLVPTPLRPAG